MLRLVQAGKTLLAVVVMLGVFWLAGVQTRMIAAVGAAFVIQCTSTGSLRRRQGTRVVAGLAMTGLVGLGAMSGGHPWGRDVLLVVLALVAFYVRRFLPDRGMFPMFGFTLTLLTTAMPGGVGACARGGDRAGSGAAGGVWDLLLPVADGSVAGVCG